MGILKSVNLKRSSQDVFCSFEEAEDTEETPKKRKYTRRKQSEPPPEAVDEETVWGLYEQAASSDIAAAAQYLHKLASNPGSNELQISTAAHAKLRAILLLFRERVSSDKLVVKSPILLDNLKFV